MRLICIIWHYRYSATESVLLWSATYVQDACLEVKMSSECVIVSLTKICVRMIDPETDKTLDISWFAQGFDCTCWSSWSSSSCWNSRNFLRGLAVFYALWMQHWILTFSSRQTFGDTGQISFRGNRPSEQWDMIHLCLYGLLYRIWFPFIQNWSNISMGKGTSNNWSHKPCLQFRLG